MKNIFILILCVLFAQTTIGQTVGKIKAETYQAEFEKRNQLMMYLIIGVKQFQLL